MADLTPYLLVISVVSFVFWLKQKITRGRKRYPNGPFGLPIVGHLPFFGKLPTTTFFRWWQQYGDVFRIKLGSWNTVVVNGFSTIKEVTSHTNDAFSGRPKFVSTEILQERTGEEIFSFGNFSPVYLKQQKMTKKALRMFTSGRPEIVDELVTSEASLFVDQMLKNCRTIPGYVECEVQTFALRVSYQLMYGRGNDDNMDRKVKLLAKFHRDFNVFTASYIDVLPWLRYVMPWKISWLREHLSKLYGIQDEQVREHYEAFSRDDIRDVADAFLASDADDGLNTDRFVLSRARLNNTLTELLSGGFHPTSATLLWLLLYMTAYPDVQERVHEEIDTAGKGSQCPLRTEGIFPLPTRSFLK